MVYLTAAVVLVGVLCALDLLLTVGVIRRLRVHTGEIEALRSSQAPPDSSLPVGSPVPAFEAVDADGAPIATAELAGGSYLLAFLATDCHACKDQLAQLASYAGRMAGARRRVLAIVDGPPEEAGEYRRQLGGVARLVLGADAARIRSELDVNLFPTFVFVDEQGVVSLTRFAVRQLPVEPVAAGGSVGAG